MVLDLIAELEALIESFERGGVEYALCGGLAVAIHGHPRATMGIDVLVQPEQLAIALQAARATGFDIPARKMVFGLRAGTPREMQRVSKLDPETNELMSLDLIVVGPGLDEVWNGRLLVRWRERDVAIVSRAGLATMKRLAGRPMPAASHTTRGDASCCSVSVPSAWSSMSACEPKATYVLRSNPSSVGASTCSPTPPIDCT